LTGRPVGARSTALNPRFTANLRFLAVSLVASGQVDEARKAGLDLWRVHPKFSARRFREGHALRAMLSRTPDKSRLFGEHLVKAGLPE
jgi:hypothetical protein